MIEFNELNKVLALPNWEEELQNRAITVKWTEDRQFFLLKYNQLASNFNDPVVRACRGVIYSAAETPFKCVCAPFVKFGNYGEGYCPEIDWYTARVLEKIDGSLMKMWFYNGDWHLSTNGTVDAFCAEVNDDLSFGQLFELALGQSITDWATRLDSAYTYMFELTAPENRVVIEYKERKIWFLSRRNIETLQEDYINDTGLEQPKMFYLSQLSDCLSVVSRMSKDEEGVVVNDGWFNRIKIKSPEYLIACHLVNNHAITTKRIIQMIKDLNIDDFLAYCNEYTDKVGSVQGALNRIADRLNHVWGNVSKYAVGAAYDKDGNYDREARKNFANHIIAYRREMPFLFFKCDHPEATAESYLLNCSVAALKRLVEKELQ